jgi:hypothetical protein
VPEPRRIPKRKPPVPRFSHDQTNADQKDYKPPENSTEGIHQSLKKVSNAKEIV